MLLAEPRANAPHDAPRTTKPGKTDHHNATVNASYSYNQLYRAATFSG